VLEPPELLDVLEPPELPDVLDPVPPPELVLLEPLELPELLAPLEPFEPPELDPLPDCGSLVEAEPEQPAVAAATARRSIEVRGPGTFMARMGAKAAPPASAQEIAAFRSLRQPAVVERQPAGGTSARRLLHA
jgi:hypothetical protein